MIISFIYIVEPVWFHLKGIAIHLHNYNSLIPQHFIIIESAEKFNIQHPQEISLMYCSDFIIIITIN
jgi:hypothetical protein